MDDAEAAAAATAADVPLAAFKDRPLRLLDVGSNHNPFQHHHEQFQVRTNQTTLVCSAHGVQRLDRFVMSVGSCPTAQSRILPLCGSSLRGRVS